MRASTTRRRCPGRSRTIRSFLTTEGQGGMQTTDFDKSDFIAAGQRVQDRYAEEKGDDFRALLAAIRAAAE